MLDLETLGTKPGSVIISMAAMAFDFETRKIGRTFERRIDVTASIKKGFKIDGDTLKWWLSQRPEIMAKQFEMPNQPHNVLEDFRSYLLDESLEVEGNENTIMWANSPSFDCSLLRTYYEQYNMATPWMFYSERDVRTIKQFEHSPWLKKDSSQAHDPLYDCKFQIEVLFKCYNHIGR